MSRRREVTIGEFYLSENKQTVREITALVPEYDSVRYRTYTLTLRTGDWRCRHPEHESRCTRSALFNWTAGKAPQRIVAKLNVQGVRAEAERLTADKERTLIATALKRASDEQIKNEVRRRGLKSSIGYD